MNRVALVAGGTVGVGAGISQALDHAGYLVAAHHEADDEAAAEFEARTDIPTYRFDVASPSEVKFGVHKISGDLGAIDILVHNAATTRESKLHETDPEEWQAVIRTNLSSCFHLSGAVIESMRARGFGRVVHIASATGQTGQIGLGGCSAAAAGMIGFTKALAKEGAAKGITVNAIAPGCIDETGRELPAETRARAVASIPLGRLGVAADVARGVLFLVADEADWITGSTLSINGGQHMF